MGGGEKPYEIGKLLSSQHERFRTHFAIPVQQVSKHKTSEGGWTTDILCMISKCPDRKFVRTWTQYLLPAVTVLLYGKTRNDTAQACWVGLHDTT